MTAELSDILKSLVAGTSLDTEAANGFFAGILREGADPVMTAARLAALAAKGESATELEAGARFLRAHMHPFASDTRDIVDTCGTGGTGLHTYNISTASAIVAASVGVKIAKHGNRAVSSKSGSSDVLSALGVTISTDPAQAAEIFDQIGLSFLYAPAFHDVVRYAAPVRAALGIRTVFNLLGPLANPAGARKQLIGVYAPHLLDVFGEALQKLGADHVWVVHGSAGEDEISLSGTTTVVEVKDGTLSSLSLHPSDVGIEIQPLSALEGGTPEENAAAMRALFGGAKGAYHDAVCLNAGAAIYIGGKADSWTDGVSLARDALETRMAADQLDRWISATQDTAA